MPHTQFNVSLPRRFAWRNPTAVWPPAWQTTCVARSI